MTIHEQFPQLPPTWQLKTESSSGGGITVRLDLFRKELLYDIANCGYMYGSTIGDDGVKVRDVVQGITDEGNVDMVTRLLDLGFAQMNELLYPFTKEAAESGSADDTLKETEKYQMKLELPEGVSKTSVALMITLAHDFLVNFVLARYFGLLGMDKSASYHMMMANVSADDLRSAALRQSAKLRRTLRPF